MTDGVKKGTGNSRYLKTVSNFLKLYPAYEKFAQAFIAGTLPVDFNGINAAGWQTVGTALNKANLLADATATRMGLTAAATPNQAFEKLRALVTTAQNTAGGKAQIATGSYTGTGKAGEANANVLNFSFAPKLVFVLETYKHDDPTTTSTMAMSTPMIRPCQSVGYVTGPENIIAYANVQWEDARVKWWTKTNITQPRYQFNLHNQLYFYVAIG